MRTGPAGYASLKNPGPSPQNHYQLCYRGRASPSAGGPVAGTWEVVKGMDSRGGLSGYTSQSVFINGVIFGLLILRP